MQVVEIPDGEFKNQARKLMYLDELKNNFSRMSLEDKNYYLKMLILNVLDENTNTNQSLMIVKEINLFFEDAHNKK